MMDLFQNPSSTRRTNKFEAAIWAAKLVLMSMGIISTLVLLKVAIIPHIFNLVLSTLPRFWVSARSWLSPPFIYIIVNFIIITIVALSNFQHKNAHFSDSPAPSDPKHKATAAVVATITDDAVSDTVTHPSEPENQSNKTKEEEKEAEEETEVKVKDSVLSFNETVTNPWPEKCANDYFSPDSDDTLEATWKAIKEGQGKTITPHMKKSETWTARISKAEPFKDNEEGDDDDPVAWAQRELRKSETFNETVSFRREKSMSLEELNLRAEAFIKEINNQIRLQRLESYQRFMEMVARGV